MPGDGQSLIDLTSLPEGADDQVQANVVVSGEPPVGILPESTQRELNYGCPEEVTKWALERTGPQPVVPFAEPVSLNDGYERIPRSYVICTKDRAIPPPLQRRMVRERDVTDVVEIETGHHPQLSTTDQLAELLDQRARDQVVA
jgi:hypothetical protein